jgi:hypothetical protein
MLVGGMMFDFKKTKKLNFSSDDFSSHQGADKENTIHDQFFFHDIINQTHGILLYLNQKEVVGDSLSPLEIKSLSKEIKNLQTLLCDHYKMTHKNIQSKKATLNSEAVKECLNNLVTIYLKNKKVTMKVEIKQKQTSFYQSYIQRIFTNLIKNMNEIESQNFHIELIIDDTGLYLTSSNELPGIEAKNIPEYMERLILNESPAQRESIGLDSVYSLSLELNGTFNFSIHQGKWINELFIPNLLNRANTKQAS